MIKAKFVFVLMLVFVFSAILIITSSENSRADAYSDSLAEAIVNDHSIIVSTSYFDTDSSGNDQSVILTEFGDMEPSNGTNFILISTGEAGAYPVTTNQDIPGCERGSWFMGGKEGHPRDAVEFTMTLEVPALAKYLKYDVRFLSSEYPEWVGAGYNDELRIEVNSPSQGRSTFTLDVDSNLFRDEASDLVGTGFNIFALDGNSDARDDVTTTLGSPRAGDAGATILWRVEDEHRVLGPEEVTVTITIEDDGDNMYDSTAFFDNFRFEETAEVNLEPRKYVRNLAGEEITDADAGDTIQYILQILNGGEIELRGNELYDVIDENLTVLEHTLYAEYGVVDYDIDTRTVTWVGDIPAKNYVQIDFLATIGEGTENEAIIQNQGSVFWDSDNNDILDTWSYTEIVNFTVINFEAPSYVSEDFSDDEAGEVATQTYQTREWFRTLPETFVQSTFSVASGYRYDTANSFKTKIRASSGNMYWFYNLSALESDIRYWETMFACGNNSEDADLILDFKNVDGQNIARLKLVYVHNGTDSSTDWVIQIYYYHDVTSWTLITNEYLYNGWYKIRLQRNGSSNIRYILERSNGQEIANFTDEDLSSPFSNLAKIEWYSTKEPVVCPMYFWDEHFIGLQST